MIVVVDYGMANLGSIRNMLKRVGAEAAVAATAPEIERATKLILPGVGAFDGAMRRLQEAGLVDVLHRMVLERRVPTLGLCLGMQLLTQGSEEGDLPGLGWIEGETVRFKFDAAQHDLKVPHMGWNTVAPRPGAALFRGLDGESRFYFVHSYHVVCRRDEDVAARTHYGYDFASSVARGHILGTQFHPEKSHKYGMALLRNFAELP